MSLETNLLGDHFLRERYLGSAERAVYLLRPDQHVAARWTEFDAGAVRRAALNAMGL